MDFTALKSYQKLKSLSNIAPNLTDEKVFNAKRVKKYSLIKDGFKLLYATERVNDEILKALLNLAQESNALKKMHGMQSGEIVNLSEKREALHTATRDFFENKKTAFKAKEFSDLAFLEIVKLKEFLKETDDKFDTIVQIGIGGSFLGPKAVYEALKKYAIKKRKAFFISNVDPDNISEILSKIDIKKTLFISVSKSGTTLETLTNENFIIEELKKNNLYPNEQIVSVTIKNSPMDNPKNYLRSFYIWDSIGGRFSTTSMVGAVLLSFVLGYESFEKFLKGANRMDKLALEEPEANLPLISALLGIWNRSFLNHINLAIIPYSNALFYFCNHLQQLDMESNGKSVDVFKNKIEFETGPIIFGDVGTNAQHSFFQFLHQSNDIVPIEFIGCKNSQYSKDLKINDTSSQEKLLANLFAQSISLAMGKKEKDMNKNFSGNRMSHIFLIDKLDPYTMGALLSYFEHKVAFQGFIWNINSFDQEGVELGKKLANKILDVYANKNNDFDIAKEFMKF